MSLSEKFKNIKFTKSVAGYTVKEVDAFIAEITPIVNDCENELASLRAIAAEYVGRKDEIASLKEEAYKLLEAAKAEAAKIISAAKSEGEGILNDAKISAETEIRVAKINADECVAKAEKYAKERIDEANLNAKKIISSADVKGRVLVAEAKAKYDDQLCRTSLLASEYDEFEKNFKAIVTDTAKALAALRDKSALPKIETEILREPPAEASPVLEEVAAEAASAASEPDVKQNEELVPPEAEYYSEEEVSDVTFVGGKPVIQKSVKPSRRLFDTVQVTYDSDEDDFDDIKAIMNGGDLKKRKSPTHFSE